MQNVGIVAKISGKVFVKRDGKLIALKQGDEIFLGDEIITQSSGDTIVINFYHASPITLLEPQTIIITKELSKVNFNTQGSEAQIEEDKRKFLSENEETKNKGEDDNSHNASHSSHGSSHSSSFASINGLNFDMQGHISNIVSVDGSAVVLPVVSNESALPHSFVGGAVSAVERKRECSGYCGTKC
ncbi:hypothetical protein [Campylobacter sp.]|uniref:hypothetical protein n=1 Tax=Campylobacter sp. TaxID=205 RepID=UPI003F9F0597